MAVRKVVTDLNRAMRNSIEMDEDDDAELQAAILASLQEQDVPMEDLIYTLN
jgi:hypothetical protein